jgi:hypothetical protein
LLLLALLAGLAALLALTGERALLAALTGALIFCHKKMGEEEVRESRGCDSRLVTGMRAQHYTTRRFFLSFASCAACPMPNAKNPVFCYNYVMNAEHQPHRRDDHERTGALGDLKRSVGRLDVYGRIDPKDKPAKQSVSKDVLTRQALMSFFGDLKDLEKFCAEHEPDETDHVPDGYGELIHSLAVGFNNSFSWWNVEQMDDVAKRLRTLIDSQLPGESEATVYGKVISRTFGRLSNSSPRTRLGKLLEGPLNILKELYNLTTVYRGLERTTLEEMLHAVQVRRGLQKQTADFGSDIQRTISGRTKK